MCSVIQSVPMQNTFNVFVSVSCNNVLHQYIIHLRHNYMNRGSYTKEITGMSPALSYHSENDATSSMQSPI